MKLSKLTLKNFRNLEPLTLVPDESLNLIVGANASGKTNLCEAIVYASRGSLLKGERQRELIRWDEAWSTLDAEVGSDQIRIVLNGSDRGKQITLSGESVTHGKLFEVFKVVLFTPDDLQVVKGSPSARRRLLDGGIAELFRSHRGNLQAYEQVVRRKNILLSRERIDPELLAVYNAELVKRGAKLVETRLKYLDALNRHVARIHAELSRPAGELTLCYDSELDYGAEHTLEPLEHGVHQRQPQERRRGLSLIGPHRDDLRFSLEGMDLRRYGSQGQQKTALIATKFAQLELFREQVGEYPVLVLDDVLSELDPERTRLLLDHLPQGLQLFLTETALSAPLAARAGKVFQVAHGGVRELDKEGACS